MKNRTQRRSFTLWHAAVLTLVLLIMTAGLVYAAKGDTIIVSVSSAGAQANAYSQDPAISPDQRIVAFSSSATNLVAGDTNGAIDVFVHDITTGETSRVSVASDGTQANYSAYSPSLSSDGRYVAFTSDANTLIPVDANGTTKDVFLHDRTTGVTELVSLNTAGVQAAGNIFGSSDPSISADGRYVAFDSECTNLVDADINGVTDVFVRDRIAGTTERVSVDSSGAQGNNHSSRPAISGDGRYVAFQSMSTNLATAADTNGYRDIFVHDRTTGVTTRVSVDSAGAQATGGGGIGYGSQSPSITPDGRYVAFHSGATNLVANDTNVYWDVFVHDRTTGATTLVSVNSAGDQAADYVGNPSISADGRYVEFQSSSADLVTDDTNGYSDIFVHDRHTGLTTRVSVTSSGAQATGGWNGSFPGVISAGGRYVVFQSEATNLIANDVNGPATDIFIHDYLGGEPSGSAVPVPEPVLEPVGLLVGAAGDTYTLDGGALLIIPPGAVPDGSLLSWDLITHPGQDSSGAYPLSFAVDIRLTDANGNPLTAFNPPLELCLPVTDEMLANAGGASGLRLAWRQSMGDSNPWTFLTTRVDMIAGHGQMAIGPITHLTVFALFEASAQSLPETGFAPHVVTKVRTHGRAHLPDSTAPLQDAGMTLEIPRLGVRAPIIGVPETTAGWDVSWLGDDIGWLDGTAYPTWEGNTALTGHVYDADGEPGIFANLRTLWWGDRIVLRAFGEQHVYAVRSVRLEKANSPSSLQHEDLDWITLITCRGYDEDTGEYRWRTVVKAVRIDADD
jgi:LPXTG-site transpeptidase (sortase) family protein